jgi:transcriptional regulator with XRE-family HTH domain
MSVSKATNKSNSVTIIPIQCKLGRAALDWGVRDLAERAKVSPNTVARFERGETMLAETVNKLRDAMEAAGVEFIPENGGGAGVRLAKRRAKR